MSVAINLASPGLANRIKTYMSCFSIFDEVRTLKDADTYIFSNIKMCSENEFNKCPHFDNWRLYLSDEDLKYREEYKYIDLLYENTPKYFIDKYNKILDKLQINEEILQYVENFSKDWEKTIGLHVRSWYCDRKEWHSNELFENIIDNLDPNLKIFLCGDNKEVIDHFLHRYGNRIIIHDQEKYSNSHLAESGHNNSIQTNVDAFIDLLLLSKCDTIVGTYASTFSEVAWWFGRCNSKVIIPEPSNVPLEFKERIFAKI